MARRRKSPYEKTPMSVDQSRAQIDHLLKDHGADAVSWSTLWSQDKVNLRFIMRSPSSGQLVAFDVTPPTFKTRRKSWDKMKGANVEVEEPNWPQSFRMLYYWLKAKLEAVTWGLREIEREFLNEMVVSGPDGQETTVGEIARQQLDGGSLRLPALEPPKESRPGARVVDATVVG